MRNAPTTHLVLRGERAAPTPSTSGAVRTECAPYCSPRLYPAGTNAGTSSTPTGASACTPPAFFSDLAEVAWWLGQEDARRDLAREMFEMECG